MSSDDRTGRPQDEPVHGSTPHPDHPGVPVAEQPTAVGPDGVTGPEGPRWENPQEPAEGVTASAAEPVVGPARRGRWARARGSVRRPRTHRGRVVLTALAAVALLLVGGGVGLAIGAGTGHHGGRGSSASHDGGWSQDGGRGDDRGDDRGDGPGDRDSGD